MREGCRKISEYKNILSGLFKGFYSINICPVCHHIYLGENSICEHCGYEPEYHTTAKQIEELKWEYSHRK